MSFGNLIFRHHALAVIKFEITPLRNFKCVTDSFGWVILKNLPHFVNVLKIEMIVKPHPIWVVDGFFCLDTEKHIVHAMVRFAKVVTIICTDEREFEFFR